MKDWYKSRTIWAGVLAMVAGGAGAAVGLTIDPMTGDFSGNVYDIAGKIGPIVGAVGGAVGGIGAIVGRVKANAPIKTKSRK